MNVLATPPTCTVLVVSPGASTVAGQLTGAALPASEDELAASEDELAAS
jgi:hypothetical protein